jgi:hypothetical protein
MALSFILGGADGAGPRIVRKIAKAQPQQAPKGGS